MIVGTLMFLFIQSMLSIGWALAPIAFVVYAAYLVSTWED